VPLLRTDDMSVTFGGLKANDRISLTVKAGCVTGLIGPNGAGKTTFIDGLTGFVPTTGAIWFEGERIDTTAAHQRSRRGLGRTFQSLQLFEDLTVRENVTVAADNPPWWAPLADIVRPRRHRDGAERATWALDLLHLTDDADRLPTALSHGQRKLVGVARALAANPKLVLLDEPAAGLDTDESVALGRQLRGLVSSGITVFLIDHDMNLVLNVCDEIHVLEFGRLIASGTPAEIRTNPEVIAAYLGTSESAPEVIAAVAAAEEIVEHEAVVLGDSSELMVSSEVSVHQAVSTVEGE
jgi:ABC-type branched-subunit amino acid transport system ATPase component